MEENKQTTIPWKGLLIAALLAFLSSMLIENYWIQPACEQLSPKISPQVSAEVAAKFKLEYLTFDRYFNIKPTDDSYAACIMRTSKGKKEELPLKSPNALPLQVVLWITHPMVILFFVTIIAETAIELWLRRRQKREPEIEIMN